MEINQTNSMHPLLQNMINGIRELGVGEVVVTADGHLFFQPCVGIEYLRGAIDEKKEGEDYGVRVILRQVRKRSKNSKYAGLPWFQIYMLPIVKKEAATMTDAERRNMEQYAQALKMAHAVERDPELAVKYHKLHEAHKLNPVGYKKLYPNFFGFLVATFRMELAKAENPEIPESPERLENPESLDNPESLEATVAELPQRRMHRRAFRPFIRLPMAA